jgi:dTDP-4-amino-4,6-dideoxygalactose transaminase
MKKQFKKPIFISLSPNVEKDDLKLAVGLFLSRKNTRIEAVKILEDRMKEITGIVNCFSVNSGRSGFWLILKALNYPRDSEIIVPGFTCNVLINPIISLGFKPIYVDINEKTLNLDIEDLKTKINVNTKAIVIQHTFGLPENVEEVLKICKENNIDLIEDCAHSLGARVGERSVGSFGRAAFFSFGRDKIISSVYGGVIATNDDGLAKKIGETYKTLPECSNYWIKQQLSHPILTEKLIKPLYNFFELGKYLLIVLQKLHILSKGVSDQEKKGEFDESFVKKMPMELASLALNQLEKLDRFDEHRKNIANIYIKELKGVDFTDNTLGRVFMRFSIILKDKNTDDILSVLRKKKIFLDDGWRKRNIVPPDCNSSKLFYVQGMCPKAEWVAKHIINLPTSINISLEKAKYITESLKGII